MFFNFIKNLNSLSKTKNIIVKNLGFINYSDCYEYQKKIQNEIIQIKLNNRNNKIKQKTPNYLLFVEHNHVYTLGNSGDNSNLLFDKTMLEKKGIDFHKTNRGGDITYHGPGQMVCYPILDMENFYTDIHKYLRDLEDIIINTLSFFGINASVNSEETGVWRDVGNIKERKICAMGIKVSRWVTMHGFSLNINPDLKYYQGIIPCGISQYGVTSMASILGDSSPKMSEIKEKIVSQFISNFSAYKN